MTEIEINRAAHALLKSYHDGFQHPFPYEDCWTILQGETERYEELIPDLNTYFYTIASHCEGIKKVLSWPTERLLDSKKFLSQNFFEKYSRYEPLKSRLNELGTPRLFQRLQLCEKLRKDLLQVISLLLKDPVAF